LIIVPKEIRERIIDGCDDTIMLETKNNLEQRLISINMDKE
jgi:hypothetical protein